MEHKDLKTEVAMPLSYCKPAFFLRQSTQRLLSFIIGFYLKKQIKKKPTKTRAWSFSNTDNQDFLETRGRDDLLAVCARFLQMTDGMSEGTENNSSFFLLVQTSHSSAPGYDCATRNSLRQSQSPCLPGCFPCIALNSPQRNLLPESSS